MFAYYCPRGYGDDGEGFALGTLDGPGLVLVQESGCHFVFFDPDGGILVACKQPSYGKRHVRAAAGGAGRNHLGTRPATSDRIECQRQIGIVLVGVVALYLKGLVGIDQRATGVAHRVGISYIHVATQASAQQRVEPAVHGDNVVALPH